MHLLLNDTSDYHNGCKVVVSTFNYDYALKTKQSADALRVDYSKFETVVLNGEGTMHDRGTDATNFMKGLQLAQQAGCKTYLVNSVFQNMERWHSRVLAKCDRVIVREVLSYNHMKDFCGVKPQIAPDRSIIPDVEPMNYDHVEIYEGLVSPGVRVNRTATHPTINIFQQEWNEIVNRLRNAELLITCRHHEMYAAIKARCRFIVNEGNTWKNRGLLETVGVNLPTDPVKALSGAYDSEYEKLFDYCNQYYALHNPNFMV